MIENKLIFKEISLKNESEYECNLCNKFYCSILSLASHKKNYHNDIIYSCKICNNKKYKLYNSFKKHEKKCKENYELQMIENEEKKYKKELFSLKQEELIIKKEELFIKKEELAIKKDNLMVKKQMIIKQGNYKTINNIINNSNNISIYNFVTHEDINSPNHIKNLLARKDQIKFALNTHPSKYLTTMVEMTYCEKFKNIFLTNLNGKYIYIYKNNKFLVSKCEEVIDNIINGKICEINEMFDGLLDQNINKQPRIQDGHMKKLHINKNDFFEESKNENFKKKNKDRIIIMLYNNQDNIKDTYTLITNEELSEEQLEQIAKDNITEISLYNEELHNYT